MSEMISEWWLVGMALGFLVVLIWHGRMAYRHGIWDGAFNHFLPIVRREMLFYDKRRAEMIFESEKQ
ncbi:MAG: hypothetical protein WAN65_18545 [Candidatus Sulfotelmatobacter sp.]